ncbi:putative amino acid permease [Aspergillus aculeatinus CBS 121060]|uniref:Amino acid transporter n=1 Tax=Aspergillus aculeatinus CBS 121060 TaxID=1448322 RepID=A0ACD1GU76_9EURO|nr:amino acid transporter [Aspergillus aculeatinus CBS 121060]RAH64913.1 amino acid transporter [Aspergillus aculeatinus CBS 121060]
MGNFAFRVTSRSLPPIQPCKGCPSTATLLSSRGKSKGYGYPEKNRARGPSVLRILRAESRITGTATMGTKKTAASQDASQDKVAEHGADSNSDDDRLDILGYKQELRRNRSLNTLLFQSLAMAAIPYGEGGPLMGAIYGGGPMSIFVGWIVVCVLYQCVALSLAELVSRYPTSAGPYYWSHQIARDHKAIVSFLTGWVWIIGNWTAILSTNFGFASMLSASISLVRPSWDPNSWELLLIFYAVCVGTFLVCTFGNRFLPHIDFLCTVITALTIIVVLVALSTTAATGRHTAAYALGHYDTHFSGWGGFTFFIGLLPAAYTFCGIGLVTSMAEECVAPARIVPQVLSLNIPVLGLAGLLFILPICFTLPPMEDILAAPAGQALPYIFHRVMGTAAGGLALTSLVLSLTLFGSISATVAGSRAIYAFARDNAVPCSRFWARVHDPYAFFASASSSSDSSSHKNNPDSVPFNALLGGTILQLLLGLINLGSTSTFTAFVSVSTIALSVAYAIPIALSLMHRRTEVARAPWTCGPLLGPIVNVLSLAWIAFGLVLFSLPTALPVTPSSMNYAAVVLVGLWGLAFAWYCVYGRRVYKGPPLESTGLRSSELQTIS